MGLEAVGGVSERTGHHAGVVDENVDVVVLGEESVGECQDRRKIAQVNNSGVELPAWDQLPEFGDGTGRPLRATGQHGDQRPAGGHHPGALQAQTAGSAGYHHPLPVEIGPGEDFLGGGVLPECIHPWPA